MTREPGAGTRAAQRRHMGPAAQTLSFLAVLACIRTPAGAGAGATVQVLRQPPAQSPWLCPCRDRATGPSPPLHAAVQGRGLPLSAPSPQPMLRLRGGDEDIDASEGARRRGVQRPAHASDSAPKRPRRNARGSPAPFKGAAFSSRAGQRVDAADNELRSASSTQSDESGDNQAEGGGSRQKL